MDARLAVKSALRGVLRVVVPVVYRRPWLLALASRALSLFPSLKPRLRRVLVPAAAVIPAAPRELDDAQLRVMLDLQGAIRPPRSGR